MDGKDKKYILNNFHEIKILLTKYKKIMGLRGEKWIRDPWLERWGS